MDQLEAEPTRSVDHAIRAAEHFFDLGIPLVLIESEGLTENERAPKTSIVDRFVGALGLERLIFEAADPEVFTWCVKTYGPDVNVFVDHSQIVQLEALRAGLWGTMDGWGRTATFTPEDGPHRTTISRPSWAICAVT